LDVTKRDLLHPLQAEALDIEAGHEDAVGHGGFERFGLEVLLLGEVAHHAAGKTVARPRGIDDTFRRISGHDVALVLAEEHCAVLALLDDDELRAHVADHVTGQGYVLGIREQLRLTVVDHKAVDALEKLHQICVRGLNPQLHRVGNYQSRAGKLFERFELRGGRGIGKESKLGVACVRGENRFEAAEHIEFDVERFAVVHVAFVAARPAKRLAAGDRLNSGNIDTAAEEEFGVLSGPVAADDTDELHGREEAGGVGEVRGGAAQQAVAALSGSEDVIDSDRTDDEQGHGGWVSGVGCRSGVVELSLGLRSGCDLTAAGRWCARVHIARDLDQRD
jgi:hypothetical protein